MPLAILILICVVGAAVSLFVMSKSRNRDKKAECILAAGAFLCVALVGGLIAILTELNS